MKKLDIKQAVILAGGRGIRLRPFTENMPKPMVPIAGKPFLNYLIEELKRNGIRDIILLTGYLGDRIAGYFGDGSGLGITIRYSKDGVDTETGTRLRNARALLNDKFMLLYGDNYWPIDLEGMMKHYTHSGAPAMTTVYANKDGKGEYGPENNVSVDEKGYVVKYDKQRKGADLNGVDIGFFILDKKVVDFIPEENSSFEMKVLPVLAEKKLLSAYMTENRYYYITTEPDLKTTGDFLMSLTTKDGK